MQCIDKQGSYCCMGVVVAVQMGFYKLSGRPGFIAARCSCEQRCRQVTCSGWASHERRPGGGLRHARSADLQHTVLPRPFHLLTLSLPLSDWLRCMPMWPVHSLIKEHGVPAPCLLILR